MSVRVSKKIQSLGITSVAVLVLMAGIQSAEARRGKGISIGSSSKSSTPAASAKPDATKTGPASTTASQGSSSSKTFVFVSMPKKEPTLDETNSGPPPAFRNRPAPILQASAAGAPDEEREREAKIGIDLPPLGAATVIKAGATPGFLLMN